ncbi:anti-sigma factor domain-containing protein [Deinococcus roseus]|uniref:Regulator of SigK n=1 Tax=Deinococcus roseus TaxID=392414 RepID=A0ABQ2DM90_9DEIO|nr:anti-sigma factor [Deinococcus roseus]GGJ59998.1 anti-sigma E factor [Deinococcus roseus]
MTHPRDHLISYVLGELPETERGAMEAHLLECPVCSKKVLELQEGMEALVENLPAKPAPDVWKAIQQKLPAKQPEAPRSTPLWSRLPFMAASILVVGLLGYGTIGFIQHYQNNTLIRHFVEIAVRTETIKTKAGESIAQVMFAADGKALIVPIQQAPSGRTYQAWGRVKKTPYSLGLTRGEPIQVQYAGFERVGLSMEPSGGSEKPTQPLGGIDLL